MGILTLELPFPPSTNRYWRNVALRSSGGRPVARVLISREGREFRERAAGVIAALRREPLTGPLFMRVDLYPPDARARDLDNYDSKALCDALEHGGAFENDRQIRERLSRFHDDERIPGGLAVVVLQPLDAAGPMQGEEGEC